MRHGLIILLHYPMNYYVRYTILWPAHTLHYDIVWWFMLSLMAGMHSVITTYKIALRLLHCLTSTKFLRLVNGLRIIMILTPSKSYLHSFPKHTKINLDHNSLKLSTIGINGCRTTIDPDIKLHPPVAGCWHRIQCKQDQQSMTFSSLKVTKH